jgi:hypothetical protein
MVTISSEKILELILDRALDVLARRSLSVIVPTCLNHVLELDEHPLDQIAGLFLQIVEVKSGIEQMSVPGPSGVSIDVGLEVVPIGLYSLTYGRRS